MSGLEITGIIVGGLASGEAARRTLWKWVKGLARGAHAVAKFGEALPRLSVLPARMDQFEKKLESTRQEVMDGRQELRDHMDIEDEIGLQHEQAWVKLLETQHVLARGQADIHHEVENLQQIVMNQQEAGTGDVWRLNRHHDVESESA